jgi:hypothetical protein
VTGSVHEHDELTDVLEDGQIYLGNATVPHFIFTPLEDRIIAYERGDSVFAIYRLAMFMDPVMDVDAWYSRCKMRVSASLNTMDRLRIRYNLPEVLGMWFGWALRKLGMAYRGQCEQRIYCTESCEVAWGVAGINLTDTIGPQEHIAPIHIERLVWNGTLRLVKDYGLDSLIRQNALKSLPLFHRLGLQKIKDALPVS